MEKLYRIQDINCNLCIARFSPLDVLVVGSTGAGKSSTINALFQDDITKIGRSCEPETMSISSMSLNERMRFWDSPGLGDNVERDKNYAKKLLNKLYDNYYLEGQRYGLIDTVLVILDGSARDMGTTYRILNDVIVPNFQVERVLVAINQADVAMKGRHWDEEKNKPDEVLKKFLDDKVKSVSARIAEATGVKVTKPVYYSAERNYNIEKLLDLIIDHMPRERRNLVV